jgi:hypothetical protein
LTTRKPADRGLSDLVAAARQALGDTLDSIVLYGSAAEARLRPASDVNVIFVLIVSMPRRVHAACVSDCLFASGGDRSGSSRCGRCSSIVCRCRSPDPVYDLLVEVGAPVRRPPTVILERDGVFCVMRPEFETFLARLYTDAPSRARFLPAPREEADRHGLTVGNALHWSGSIALVLRYPRGASPTSGCSTRAAGPAGVVEIP